jgi:hypothetical protein
VTSPWPAAGRLFVGRGDAMRKDDWFDFFALCGIAGFLLAVYIFLKGA